MIKGLKPTSRRLPKWIANALRANRFYSYGWRSFAINYDRPGNFAVNRSNRVYNFIANRGKTGKLFDSRGY